MTKFNITLTMDDGRIEPLALTKSQLAHIFAGPTITNCKLKLSNDDLETAFSIIKLGIVDYANIYNNVKHCTIVDRYNNKTIEYDFNTNTDIIINNDSFLYYYILDASIEYNFNIVKTKLLHQYALYIKDGIDVVDISKLFVIVQAIVDRFDIAYYNKKLHIITDEDNYKPPFEKDDIFAICDCIAYKKDDIITWFKIDDSLNRILSYFNGTYEPYSADFNTAYEKFMEFYR